jgi:pyruvate,orthophosphate dikinase
LTAATPFGQAPREEPDLVRHLVSHEDEVTAADVAATAAGMVPYGQGRARGLDTTTLGRHGMQMDDMVALGLPVVPGVTVPLPESASLREPAVAGRAIELVELLAGRLVGADDRPMLLRLVASAPVPVAGLPPDVVCLGLTSGNLPRLAASVGRDRDLLEAWTTTLRYLGEHALGVPADALEEVLLDHADRRERVDRLLEVIGKLGSGPYPVGPAEQLALAATAILARWASPRAQRARRAQRLPDDLGLALHVQALRIGPWERSGHGTATSRDAETGAFRPTGGFFRGVRHSAGTPSGGEPLDAVPGGAALLDHALMTLERHGRGVATVEYEVRDGELSLLSSRIERRPAARVAVRLACDLVAGGVLTPAQALRRVTPEQVQELLHARLRLTGKERVLVRGLPASPGAASGQVVLSSARAVEFAAAGTPVVLVVDETTPADVPGLVAAAAVLTGKGGLASHAAVVARGAGRPAVCGAAELELDPVAGTVAAGDVVIREGDQVSLDGRSGMVYLGAVDVGGAEPPAELAALLGWADGARRLGVRANADTAADAERAFRLGAEGIGLCRTEHQFLGDRLGLIRRVLLAVDEEGERAALAELVAAQRADFAALLAVVGDRPVTVRLLDAPMHEFLPGPGEAEDAAQEARAAALREVNPMLGVRGVRLAALHGRLYPAQADALFSAYAELVRDGAGERARERGGPALEVMVPLVSLPEELELAARQIREAAAAVETRTGVRIDYRLGCMVETPRAALLAGRLAEHAEFLSFGTNDLTQLTYGFSRDDIERRVLAPYAEQGLCAVSPFAELDPDGVGALVEIAVGRARAVRPDVKLGLCGEHGGDPASVSLCDRLGLDYVSCSPQRVPVARLAAAHAASPGGTTEKDDHERTGG